MALLKSTDIYGSLYVQGTQTTGSLTTTGVFSAPLGSASLPSYTFTGDLDTGIFSPAANILAFTTGSSERFRITSDGNIGINTTTPASLIPNIAAASGRWIEVKSISDSTDTGLLLRRSDNATGFDVWVDNSTGNNYLDNRWNGNLIFRNSTNGTPVELARLNSTGLGIGINPTVKLDVNGDAKISGSLTVTGNINVNNIEMISTSNGVIFEGTTANDFETTLIALDPTADQTYQLPNKAAGTYTLATTADPAPSVANSLVIKSDSGTTEGTDLYTFNGSVTKSIDFKSGTNVTLTEDVGTITFSSPSLSKGTDSGSGSFVTDVAVSGHTITLSKGNFTETTLSEVSATGDYMTDISVSGHQITETKANFSTLTISTGLSGTSYNTKAATTIALTEITPGTTQADQGALWYHGITPEAGKFDGSTTNPSAATRLNYGGYLYATKLYSGGTEVLTAHPTITKTTDTTSNTSPAFGGTFTAIDSVTRDSNGHVTTLNTKTVTLPTPNYPTGFSISAGATDGIFDITGTGGTNSVSYSFAPYSAKQTSLQHFYLGTTNPDQTTRLNFDGYLYATQLYDNGSRVLTAESDTLATVTGRGATTATAVSITNATASTTTGTGALIVTGGVGIGGAANISGTLTTGNRIIIDYSAIGGDGTWDKSGLLIKNMNASSAETAIAMQNASTTASNYWIHGLNQSTDYKFAYGNGFSDSNVKFTIDTNGNLSTPAGSTSISKAGQSGTNIAGGNLTIMSGAGTGSATGSIVVIQTPTTTTSGTAAQSLATRVTIGQTDTTIANNLIVSGNLTINGTTTTINTTNQILNDPIMSLGGTSTLSSNDSKDRGIEFRHFNVSEKFGFFGYDNSLQRFTFLPEATNSSEIFSGNTGIARFAKLELGNLTGNIGIFETLAASTDKTYTFPNASGIVALTSDLSHTMTSTSDHTAGNWKIFHSNGSGQVVELGLGSTGQVLKSNGATAAPSWQADNNTTAITWGAGTATSGTDKISFLSKESTDITAAKYTTLVAGTNVAFNVGTAGQLTISSTDTNTLNTAGSTNISTKIFLVGASTQASSAQTYSDDEVYVTSGVLTTKEVQVGGTSATMKYDSTSKSIKFVFA